MKRWRNKALHNENRDFTAHRARGTPGSLQAISHPPPSCFPKRLLSFWSQSRNHILWGNFPDPQNLGEEHFLQHFMILLHLLLRTANEYTKVGLHSIICRISAGAPIHTAEVTILHNLWHRGISSPYKGVCFGFCFIFIACTVPDTKWGLKNICEIYNYNKNKMEYFKKAQRMFLRPLPC